MPVTETRVALVSERLTIHFEDDGARYRVRAEYVLANPGPKVSIKYGVPLFWYPPDLGEVDGPDDPAKRRLVDKEGLAYPNDVRIAIGDRRFPCARSRISLSNSSIISGESLPRASSSTMTTSRSRSTSRPRWCIR